MQQVVRVTLTPTAPKAAGLTLLMLVLIRVLGNVVNTDSLFVARLLPFIVIAVVLWCARYATRAWSATTATPHSGTRAMHLALIVLVLLTDGVVILYAAFIGLLMFTGPIVK